MKLKVCGMREAENIVNIAEAGVDYLGFIFYPGSPRFVGRDFVLPEVKEGVEKVGVFVNATLSEICRQHERLKLDVIQLHGDESPQVCGALTGRGVRVIKVFSVDDDFDFGKTRDYSGVVEYFLFDTKGVLRGGNARVFNWDVLQRYDLAVPFFLSGGLNPENISRALKLAHPQFYALDVNSGVEAAPGLKDVAKVAAISKLLNTSL